MLTAFCTNVGGMTESWEGVLVVTPCANYSVVRCYVSESLGLRPLTLLKTTTTPMGGGASEVFLHMRVVHHTVCSQLMSLLAKVVKAILTADSEQTIILVLRNGRRYSILKFL